MMKAVRTSETSVDNHFTRQYIPEDNSVHVISLFLWVQFENEGYLDVVVKQEVYLKNISFILYGHH
jgi:hypothetical protein